MSLVIGAIMVEIVYSIIRIAPQRWWIIAWAVFVGLFLLMAQLAPVVLMPIFYKFEPLANDGLRDRLTKLGEASRHARARRLRVEAFGEDEQGQRRIDRDRVDSSASFFPTRCSSTTATMRSKPSWPMNSDITCISTS